MCMHSRTNRYYLLISVNVEPPFGLSLVAWLLVDLQGLVNALIYGFTRNCMAQLLVGPTPTRNPSSTLSTLILILTLTPQPSSPPFVKVVP